VPSWELCLASFPGVALANDDCRSLGRECRRDSQCCSGNCVRRGDDKVCGCRAGQTLCKKPRGEGRCVNLQTNERHCGSCGNRCEEGEQCVDGVCQGTCPGTPLTEGDCNCAVFCDAPDSTLFACQSNPDCLCTETTEGTGFCSDITGPCEPPCSSSSDCPSGWKCQVNSCCATPVCGPPCSSSTSAAPASSARF
jgi:Stigma-specific protein, Stig1